MDKLFFVESTSCIKEEPIDIKEESSTSRDTCINETLIVKQELDSSSTDNDNSQASASCPQNKKEVNTSRKKVMRSQARELIAMVYQHMKKEALHGVKNVTDARWRTSQATGVSEKTVSRIIREKKESDKTGQPIRSPLRNRKPRRSLRRNIDENDKVVIKDTISTFKSEFNKSPTLHGLKKVLKDRIGFNGCIETLRRVLVDIGYEFKATKNKSSRYKELVRKVDKRSVYAADS